MDVFLMVRRKKSTIFLDAKENTTVLDLKKMIEGITKKAPADQQLYNKEDTGNKANWRVIYVLNQYIAIRHAIWFSPNLRFLPPSPFPSKLMQILLQRK